jgi:hypothetical protein
MFLKVKQKLYVKNRSSGGEFLFSGILDLGSLLLRKNAGVIFGRIINHRRF